MAVTINEQYRSLLGNYICNKNKDIDFVLIINFERFSCSLRCEKDGVDVSVIASEFQHDGGGHTKSSGFILDSESIPKIKKYVDLYLDNICKWVWLENLLFLWENAKVHSKCGAILCVYMDFIMNIQDKK